MPDAFQPWLAAPALLLPLAGIMAVFSLGVLREARLRRHIRAGKPGARLKAYDWTMIQLWGLTALVIAVWLADGRSLTALGLGLGHGAWTDWLGWGIALSACGYLLYSVIEATLSRSARETLRKKLGEAGDFELIRPETEAEYRRFNLVALTAGVTEEIIFRGYLIALLALVLPLWAAAILALLVFTLGHTYQGVSGMLRVVPIAAVLTLVFLLCGSLWPAILLHAVIDLVGGALFRIAGSGPAETSSPAEVA